MNERIKELLEQATEVYDYWYRGESACMVDQKMFAELIIQECVSTLNDMHLWQSANNQNYPNAWHDAVDQGIEAIKSHFGVLE